MEVAYRGDTGLEKDRMTIDSNVRRALDIAKDRVLNKNYDYDVIGNLIISKTKYIGK